VRDLLRCVVIEGTPEDTFQQGSDTVLAEVDPAGSRGSQNRIGDKRRKKEFYLQGSQK
jgi:hypothetical protein